MRTSWLIGALVTFVIGWFLTSTIIGAIIGIPLIGISVCILVLGLIIPGKVKEVHIHHHNKRK
jgi:hypothetical protein